MEYLEHGGLAGSHPLNTPSELTTVPGSEDLIGGHTFVEADQ